jgi:hypothetical protein
MIEEKKVMILTMGMALEQLRALFLGKRREETK